MMKKIILIILIFFSNTSILKADIWAPLFRISYDFNLGYTTSIGVAWTKTEGGEVGAGGAYFLYSFSHKKNKALIDGKNFSIGAYGGIGIASFRFGINNMIINHVSDSSSRSGIHKFNKFSKKFLIQESGSYWGIEASSMFFAVTSSGGFLFNRDTQPKFNGSIGLGIF